MQSSSKWAWANLKGSIFGILVSPAIVASIAIVSVLGFVVDYLEKVERQTQQSEDLQVVERVAVLLEQNVYRLVNEIDRILLFVRQSRERSGYTASWSDLIDNKFTVHDQVVLISVVDRGGLLVTSTRDREPTSRVNLSDRPHFSYHLISDTDALYISKPVIGRVSGKKTIQFTRRIVDANGDFDGVVVASLDPSLLIQSLGSSISGNKGGFAVLHMDRTVLAGARTLDGEGIDEYPISSGLYRAGGTAVYGLANTYGPFVAAERSVAGYPLSVTVVGQDTDINVTRGKVLARRKGVVLLLSLVIVIGAFAMAVFVQTRREQIGFLANYDPLTGLANRAQFNAVFAKQLGSASGQDGLALHMVDLDGFKQVNDSYGHPIGDKLLIAVSKRLRENVRDVDLVARMGGDEFAVIQTSVVREEQAVALAQRLCDVMREPFGLDGIVANIGASVGLEIVKAPGMRSSEVISRADLALYAAKAAGRSTYRIYADGMKEAVTARNALENELRKAVDNDEFELHYQPIVAIGKQKISGYEALIRWRHPKRGLIPPSQFIPVAEETKLIVAIGAWVLHKACSDIASRPGDLKIAVNISPVQFQSAGLLETIQAALSRSGLAPERLEIEITESTLMQSTDKLLALLQSIAKLGVKIAMDDFGTGYSSLSYLQKFPIDCIKIDRTFVNELGETSGQGLVRAITSMAQSLGKSTVAEGVETPDQLRQLKMLGCTEAQGYLFSEPKSADEILPPIDHPIPAAA